MLSYQHLYHAGSAADLHKHIVLAELLARLVRKPRGVSYVETHAGRGVYDLGAPESEKTGEASRGIGRISPGTDTPYGAALASTRSTYGVRAYPGSPAIARALLRPQDRIELMELHPAEHAALGAALAGGGVAIHRRDGREGVLALAPFRPRRGLVLVDPSYEIKSEYRETAAFARRLVAKWPEAAILIWYPILQAGREEELLDGLSSLPRWVDEVDFDPAPSRGMTGSGLVLINGPYGAETAFHAAQAIAGAVLKPRR